MSPPGTRRRRGCACASRPRRVARRAARNALDDPAVAHQRLRALGLRVPEARAERARDAGRGAHRDRQPRAARRLDDDRGGTARCRRSARRPRASRASQSGRAAHLELRRCGSRRARPRRARAAPGPRRGRAGRRGRRPHDRAAVGLDLHQPLGLELQQRLADRRPRRAEALRERLRPQPLAGLQLAFEDRLLQQIPHPRAAPSCIRNHAFTARATRKRARLHAISSGVGLRVGGGPSASCSGCGSAAGASDHSPGRSLGGRGSFQPGPSIVERRQGTQRGALRSAGSSVDGRRRRCVPRRSVRATTTAASASASRISGIVRSRLPPGGSSARRRRRRRAGGRRAAASPPPGRARRRRRRRRHRRRRRCRSARAARPRRSPPARRRGVAGATSAAVRSSAGRAARTRRPGRASAAGSARCARAGSTRRTEMSQPPGDAAARARRAGADARAQREHAALGGGEVVEAALALRDRRRAARTRGASRLGRARERCGDVVRRRGAARDERASARGSGAPDEVPTATRRRRTDEPPPDEEPPPRRRRTRTRRRTSRSRPKPPPDEPPPSRRAAAATSPTGGARRRPAAAPVGSRTWARASARRAPAPSAPGPAPAGPATVGTGTWTVGTGIGTWTVGTGTGTWTRRDGELGERRGRDPDDRHAHHRSQPGCFNSPSVDTASRCFFKPEWSGKQLRAARAERRRRPPLGG